MAATLLATSLLGTTGYAVARAPGRDPAIPTSTVTVTRTVTLEGRYQGLTALTWAHKAGERQRAIHILRARSERYRRTLMHRGSVAEAINLAAATYGYGPTLWQLARCESHLYPGAQNASGSSGLFQFMPGTFASTPYRGFSIWSPYANALAAGWMLTQGRRSEWVC